jgi:hypothetical protein
MELKDINRLAQTKQRNNITNLHTRQTNATNNFAIPKTPGNVKHMQLLGIVGNKSTRPYTKLKANLQDAITGEWLIYNGWAVVTSTSNDFKVTLYDGVIDFYKAIENKTLTDVNISGLSHLKNVANVTASFLNNLPYMYIFADFNGNNYDGGTFNIDYQVPSARMSYIWDRIHQFAGFTYSGAIFQTQKFLNWFMTFPKPVPVTGTNYLNVETHVTGVRTSSYSFYSGNILWQGIQQIPDFFPNSPYPSNTYVNIANNRYVFLQAGIYKIRATGEYAVTSTFVLTNTTYFREIQYYVYNSAGTFIDQGTFSTAGLGYVILTLNVGDQISFSNSAASDNSFGPSSLTGSFELFVDKLNGYQVNFDDVLVDFLATDFVKEVVNHFALTPFKDKYSNHIEYRTLKEIIQENDVLDWSNKYPVRLNESYVVGSYAQSNEFTYKYDIETLTYNNGQLKIDNQNLKERTVVVQSKFYTPTNNFVEINAASVNVYKIWDKEIKENNTIEYKELSGRFYTLRYSMVAQNINIKSKALSQSTTYTGNIPYASNWRLSWDAILVDNYKQISQILNTSKIVEANLYLTSKDVSDFDFKRMIYIEQWSSYYIVNKIVNFIKDKYTKVELIEVDYYTEGETIGAGIVTFINITNVVVNGCTITVTFSTDAILPIPVSLEVTQYGFGVFSNTLLSVDTYSVTATTNTAVFVFTGIVNALTISTQIRLWLGTVGIGLSSSLSQISLTGCVVPTNCTYINLISLQTLYVTPELLISSRQLQITFASDLILPKMMRFHYDNFSAGLQYQDIYVTSNVFTVSIQHDYLNIFGGGTIPLVWDCYLSQSTVSSNHITSYQ